MRATVVLILLCSIAPAQGIPKQLQQAGWADARAVGALAEACRKLTELSGVTVRADGETSQPISFAAKETSFWEIVLEICRKGDVGLAPHYREHRYDTWMPGFRGSRVILGGKHPRPTHAYADGPVLVQLSASEIGGERAGFLEITVRYVPELPVHAMALPRLRGDDWES